MTFYCILNHLQGYAEQDEFEIALEFLQSTIFTHGGYPCVDRHQNCDSVLWSFSAL